VREKKIGTLSEFFPSNFFPSAVLSICMILSSLGPSNAFAQKKRSAKAKSPKLEGKAGAGTARFNIAGNFKPITLNQVIQQGLKDNHDQKTREMQNMVLDLQWAGVWDQFWIPTLSLSLETTDQRFTRFRRGTSSTPVSKSPTGTAGLELSEYTVFNWGKDYLDYLNNKESIRRSKQVLTEEKRALKHRLIISYFDLVTKKEVEVFMRDQLRHASFVYRLNREKVSAQKIGRLDYQQSRSEFLRAQSDYYDARRDLEQAQEELAFLVDDNSGTRYVIQEALEYRDSKVELNEANDMAKRNSPTILSAKLNEDVAERRLDKARRNNLPLPKFSINFGAYTQSFGRSTYTQDYNSANNNSSVELVATIDATWTLYGDAGFFNYRDLQEAGLNKRIADRQFLRSNDFVLTQIKILHDRIKNYEKQLSALETRVKNSRKTYDVALDTYTKNRARFPDFLLALRDLTESEIAYARARFQHLKAKVEMANWTGVEDFPGERFEDLAQKTKSFEDVVDETSEIEAERKQMEKQEQWISTPKTKSSSESSTEDSGQVGGGSDSSTTETPATDSSGIDSSSTTSPDSDSSGSTSPDSTSTDTGASSDSGSSTSIPDLPTIDSGADSGSGAPSSSDSPSPDSTPSNPAEDTSADQEPQF